MKSFILAILLLFIVVGVAPVAEGIQVDILLNGELVHTTADVAPCAPPAGGTCSVVVDIPAGDFSDSNSKSVTIFEGGQGTADAVDGSGNKMSVHDLVFLYNGSGPEDISPGTVVVKYRHKFVNVNTNTTSGRQYAHNATGNFCRIDLATGDCLTASGDSITLTSNATLEEGGVSTRTSTSPVGQGLAYNVASGGISNNDFNPDKFVPIGDLVNIKCPFLKAKAPNCETFETIESVLNFTVQPNDAVLLLASPQAVSGPNTAIVQNLLNTNQQIDVQPNDSLDNNDYNAGDNGTIFVKAYSSEGFNACNVDPATVGLSIGRSDFVSPRHQPQDDLNPDGTCAGRRFQFSTPALVQAGATLANCKDFPVAVLVGSAEFSSSFTQSSGGGRGKKGGSSAPLPSTCQVNGTTVTCTEDLQWSGSQVVKCAVPS